MALYGMPPSLRPRKGTPEAIILEQLESHRALREKAANSAPARRAENKTENKVQPSAETPRQNPNPNCMSKESPKEKQQMPAAPATPPKTSPRARKPARRGGTAAKPRIAPESSIERHARKCQICRHPDRETIEAAFLRWDSPATTAFQFELGDKHVVYRHARATGLDLQHRHNLRVALENVIERSEEVEFTAATFIRAIRAHACLTDSGQWIEPEKRVVVTTIAAPAPQPASPLADLPRIPQPASSLSYARNSFRQQPQRGGRSGRF